jgi:ATP phosphoribosyltransferase
MTPLRLALPKGRLLEEAILLLARAGIRPGGDYNGSRKLMFPDQDGRIHFVTLKPVDIPVYVESGAIDVGIVGSDILRELDVDVYEPLDLEIGKCRMVLAAPRGTTLSYDQELHVATKYPRTAERFFASRNAHVHVVRLEGSVEIAPVLGLSSGIIDLVETGRTLRDNELVVLEEVERVSAKLIINRTAMKIRSAEIRTLIAHLDRVVYAHP